MYTQEQLLSWKQMDAFNYFQAGHVRTYRFGPGKEMVVLKAKVNPSQRPPNETITTKKQSSATTTSTSLFNQKSFVNGLMDVMPQAVIHSSFTPLKSTQPVRKVVRKLPVSLTMLKNSKYTAMTKDELKTTCEEVFSKSLNVSVEEAEYLEESTRQQSHSLLWYDQRAGRITASMFGKVARASPDSPPNSLIDTLMQKSRFNSAKVPALQWGLSIVAAKGQLVNLEYFNSGLHVNPSFPHLGATPDGMVSCECCGKGLIEIKCHLVIKISIHVKLLTQSFT